MLSCQLCGVEFASVRLARSGRGIASHNFPLLADRLPLHHVVLWAGFMATTASGVDHRIPRPSVWNRATKPLTREERATSC